MTVEQLINKLKKFPPQTPVLIFGGDEYGYSEMNDSGDIKLETLDEVQYPNSAHYFVEPKLNHASHRKFIKRGKWLLLG